MLVALKISYCVLSTAELQDGITKQPNKYTWSVFWLPSVCKYYGEQKMCSAHTQSSFISYWLNSVAVNMWSLRCLRSLTLSTLEAFAVWWNPKHSSYISIRLFCKSMPMLKYFPKQGSGRSFDTTIVKLITKPLIYKLQKHFSVLLLIIFFHVFFIFFIESTITTADR